MISGKLTNDTLKKFEKISICRVINDDRGVCFLYTHTTPKPRNCIGTHITLCVILGFTLTENSVNE